MPSSGAPNFKNTIYLGPTILSIKGKFLKNKLASIIRET